MSDGEVDIRLLALRRQQKRHQGKSNTIEHQVLEPANNNSYSRVRSGHSAYETTPIKAYAITDSSRNSTPRRNSFLSNITVPLFDEDVRIARMHVPPVIRCECNGIEAYALISTSETVSTISIDFVRKLKLLDQVIPEPSNVYNPLALHNPELKGKVKYIDLAIGMWQQVAQFNIVESYASDITLGIDFLRRTQSMVNFEDCALIIGGNKGEKIPFLTTREIMSLARRNGSRQAPVIMGNGFSESE